MGRFSGLRVNALKADIVGSTRIQGGVLECKGIELCAQQNQTRGGPSRKGHYLTTIRASLADASYNALDYPTSASSATRPPRT